MLKKIKYIFETKMFALTFLPLFYLIFIDNISNYPFNRSIGWAFDIAGISRLSIYFILTYLIGFSFLAIIKTKTYWSISLLLFLTYIFFCVLQDGNIQISFLDNVLIFMTFLFLIIFIQAILQKIKQS